jgi:CheY-like chemotaxis protein
MTDAVPKPPSRILIVDDELRNVKLIEALLHARGYA